MWEVLDIYYFQDQLTDEDYEKLEKILDVTSKDKVKEKIKLEYHYITDDSETYVNSPQYLSDRALGIAGNFHIVAFNTATLGAHTNGNVLAGKLYANSNFGTNTKDKVSVDESSYVYDSYEQVNATSRTFTNRLDQLKCQRRPYLASPFKIIGPSIF